jgi:hypothetical protein
VIDKQDIVHQISNVIENVTNHTYSYDIVGGGCFNDNTEGVRLWTIEDAKDGDVLYSPCFSLLWIFKSRDTVYCCYNLKNNSEFCGEGYLVRNIDAIPATKMQRDLFFKKLKEAGYEWDAETKELKKIDNEIEELREKKMISLKDACKWLSDNRDHPFIGCEDPCLSGYLTDEFIEDFRKTMEE